MSGWRIRLLDGSHRAGTEHRREALRTTWAGAFPGTVLAVLDQPSQLVTDVLRTPDGPAQERSLLEDVLEQIRARDGWIADRNFGTLKVLLGSDQARAAFVIGQHGTLKGRWVGQRRPIGRTETGMGYEQRIVVAFEGCPATGRRVTVALDQPTSAGDTAIHILTNRTEAQATGCAVAELDRKRWTIEGRFYEVTQTRGYPQAALVAFCLALLASKAVALLTGALRSVHGAAPVRGLSAYELTLEIQPTYRGRMVVLPDESWSFLGQLTAAKLARVLGTIAAAVPLPRYAKSKRGPKKKPPPRDRYSNGKHVSTHELLEARKG